MGYRYHFYSIPKTFVKEIQACKSITDYTELCKKYNIKANSYISIYEIGTEVYDFGKEISFFDYAINNSVSLFTCDELKKQYEEEQARVCSQDVFKAAIDSFAQHIKDYLADLLQEKSSNTFDERSQEERMHWYIKCRFDDWNSSWYTPYNDDIATPKIVNSWDYDYAIFELIRQYKIFDWENNDLIFAGW